MRVWRLSSQRLVKETEDAPPLGDEDVRVRVHCAAATPLSLLSPSAVGRVIETGAASSHFADRRVVVPAVNACGECPTCRRGLAPLCSELAQRASGVIPEEMRARARWVLPLEEPLDLADSVGALAIGPLLYAYGWLTSAGVGGGDALVVLGEDLETRLLRQLATTRGAKVASGESVEDIAEQLRAQGVEDHPRKIFLGAGGRGELVFELARPGSIISLSRGQSPPISAERLTQRGLTVLGFRAPHPELAAEVAGLVSKAHVDLGEFTVERALESSTTELDSQCNVLCLPQKART